MKALGVVRKIDQLGRVVVPKEIRDSQGWGEGTPMEMFMTNEGLVLRPYQADLEKKEIAEQLQHVLDTTDNEAAKTIIGRALNFINK